MRTHTKNRIMTLLLILGFILTSLYNGGCIQSKNYKWEPTESEKKEIIEKASQKMAEEQEKSKQ